MAQIEISGNVSRLEQLVEFVTPGYLESLSPVDRGAALHFLYRLRSGNILVHTDIDHTIVEKGAKLDPERTFDPMQYCDENGVSTELENIDLLCIAAVAGIYIDVQTGKDANAWALAAYMQKRIRFFMDRFGMTGEDGSVRKEFILTSGRLRSLNPEKPVFFTFTVGNGGLSIDLMDGFNKKNHNTGLSETKPEGMIIKKPISLHAWEWLQRHEDLLRASTKLERRTQLGSVDDLIASGEIPQDEAHAAQIEYLRRKQKKLQLSDDPADVLYTRRVPERVPYNKADDPFVLMGLVPQTDQSHKPKKTEIITSRDQLQREVAPELTDEEQAHLRMLQASIRDFALFTPHNTKVNLVFDLEKITGADGDTTLRDRWERETGILIHDEPTLLTAFGILAGDGDFDFFRSYAQGTVFIDIAAKGINKRESGRQVKNWVQGCLRIDARELHDLPEGTVPDITKLYTITMGDGVEPRTNDFHALNGSGGAAVPAHDHYEKSENGWPVDVMKLLNEPDQITASNKLLRLMLYAVTGIDNGGVEQVDTFLWELRNERQTEYFNRKKHS